MQTHEPFPLVRREVGNSAVLERVVPAFAPLRRDAFREDVRHLRLIGGPLHELHELRFRHTGFVQQQRAQAGRELILAEVAAALRGACLVDRARQEHEPG